MLHKEMDIRFPAHISGKPILQIIFDADSMNIGGWEARQLSFVFDIIDGNFVAFCIRLGFPHFRSFTHFVFTLIIMLYLWSFFTRILRLDRLMSLLLIALLVTTPSFIYTFYYRTSKIGVTLFVLILLCEMFKLIKGKTYLDVKISTPIWITFMFLTATLALMLFDVLGGFFATVIIAYLFVADLYKPDTRKTAALFGMLIGYASWVMYFLYIGPAIMLDITGQTANTSYLTGAPFQYFFGFLFLAIPGFIIDMIRFLFGYIPETAGAILLLLAFSTAIWLSLRPKKKEARLRNTRREDSKPEQNAFISRIRKLISQYEPTLSILFLLGGIALIYTLLVTRHAPILWPDVRPTYYIMPAQAVLLFTTATLLARPRIKWQLRLPAAHYVTVFLLFIFLVGNSMGSIRIKSLLYNGDNMKLFPHDAGLIDALGHLDTPEFEPNDKIAEDPIYLLFVDPD